MKKPKSRQDPKALPMDPGSTSAVRDQESPHISPTAISEKERPVTGPMLPGRNYPVARKDTIMPITDSVVEIITQANQAGMYFRELRSEGIPEYVAQELTKAYILRGSRER